LQTEKSAWIVSSGNPGNPKAEGEARGKKRKDKPELEPGSKRHRGKYSMNEASRKGKENILPYVLQASARHVNISGLSLWRQTGKRRSENKNRLPDSRKALLRHRIPINRRLITETCVVCIHSRETGKGN
jgi:hypothetical protein